MGGLQRLGDQDLKAKIDALRGGQNIIVEGADVFTRRGYIQFPKFIFFNPNLSDADRSCYAIVLHFAFNKDQTWPGQAKLAELWGVHRNTAGSALKRLEEEGILSVIKQGGRRNDIIILFYTIAGLLDPETFVPRPAGFDPGKLGFGLSLPQSADLRTQYGWIEVPVALYEHQGLSDAARTLYVLLLNFAQGKDTCWPSQERLADILGKSVRTIEDNIKMLKQEGFITAVRADGRMNNIYTLNVRVQKQRKPGD